MKIDFTQFENPVDALALSEWEPNADLDISPEEAALAASLAGIDLDEMDSEYLHPSTKVDFRFSPIHTLVFDASSMVVDVRSNDSLRSIRIRSDALGASEIYELAELIVQDWKLHCFDGVDDEPKTDAPPEKIDGIAELTKWRNNPSEDLPSYLAQTDANPGPGLWFLRLVINPQQKSGGLFVISTQIFWRDAEFDQQHRDNTFWERADALINVANEQSSDERVSRVAKSFLYAAARYNAFDYWNLFGDPTSFNESKEEAIQQYVDQFKEMLVENFDDHLDRFNSSGNGG